MNEQNRQDQDLIDIQEFMKIELRVGRILKAEPIPGSRKLMRLEVSLGEHTRQIVAGIAREYNPEDLMNRKIIVVANLKPARLMGYESQGMLLAADIEGRPVVILVPDEVPEGSRIR